MALALGNISTGILTTQDDWIRRKYLCHNQRGIPITATDWQPRRLIHGTKTRRRIPLRPLQSLSRDDDERLESDDEQSVRLFDRENDTDD